MIQLNILFAVFIFAATYPLAAQSQSQDIAFGGCLEGNKSCKDCYLALKQELLKRDDNVFQLSRTFFPPDTNPPEFVAVTYEYYDGFGLMNGSQTWYWIEQSSYLLFPPDTFQYVSLFFGKPEEYYAQKVSVTLAADCKEADEMHMTLLTQRLKAFIQRKSFNPVIDNTYSAKAGKSLQDILDNSNGDAVITFIYAYHTFVFILIILLAILTPFVGNYHKLWLKKIKKIAEHNIDQYQKEALLISITLVSILITAYILILDMLALNIYIKNQKLSLFINDKLFHIPVVIFVCDFLFTLLSVIFIIITFSCCCCDSKCYSCEEEGHCLESCSYSCVRCRTSHSCKVYKEHYFFLVLIILCQMIIFVTHIPFIVIAFLNDAYHAGSIFIFYAVSFLLLLSVIEVSYHTFKRMIPIKENEAIKLNCYNSSLDIVEESDNLEDDPEGVLLDTFKLKFKNGRCTDISADITLQDDKVVKGKLTSLKIEFDSMDDNIFDKFKKLEPTHSQKLRLDCTLVLQNKKEISASGQCEIEDCEFNKTESVENPKYTIYIKECELINDSGIILPDTVKDAVKKALVCTQKICIYICMVVLVILVLCGIILTAAYLVLIPINRSISDAPNRLIGVYNTVFLIIGVYIAYKTLFQRKINLKYVVQSSKDSLSANKNDEEWSLLSKEEKLAEFYRTQAEMIKCQAAEYCTER